MDKVTTSVKTMTLENILAEFKMFGRYHMQTGLLIFFAFFKNTLHCNNYVFAAENIEYRCINNSDNAINSSSISDCKEWLYENPYCMVAEFNLGGQEWKRTLVGTIHCFGYMVGLLIVGSFSDSVNGHGIHCRCWMSHLYVKVPLICCFFACATLCISQSFVPANLPWLVMTTELFSTCTRNIMQALCSSVGRIGSMIAPQTPLLISYCSGLPSIIFGLTSLFAGLVTLFSPDVSNDALPDTVAEAEAIGRKKLKTSNNEFEIS